MIKSDSALKAIDQSAAAIKAIRSHLAGIPPIIQGLILADLTSTWVAGHHPALRANALTLVMKLTSDLLPGNIEIANKRAEEAGAKWE